MKITSQQIKQIIKEELDAILRENENTINLKKFAMLASMLDTEKDGSSFGQLLKLIRSNETDSKVFNVYLKNFKKVVLDYFDVKFNGTDTKSDIDAVLNIAKLLEKWKQTDALDLQGQKRIMAMAFFHLPKMSPIK